MSRSAARTLLSLATALIAVVAFASPPFSSPAAAAGPMNVVLLVADDLGWADTSLLGHKNLAPTPNLDRLAARGMTFSRAYAASPLCSATRTSLMTGLHPARVGIYDATAHSKNVFLAPFREESGPANSKTSKVVSATRLKTDYFTLAEALKGAGYATGHFGKWHLGRDPYSPQAQGFDVDVPHTFSAGPPGGYLGWSAGTMKPSPAHEHIEDRMTKEAIKFLQTNRTRPFFLNYWLFSVHAPFEAKPTLVQKYKGLAAKSGSKQSPTYAGMIETMDKSVGLILETLDKLKLSENTIVIFVSDNGGNVHSRIDGVAPANNGPLRGGKGSLWEGGTRVPCVIVWPGVVGKGSFSAQTIQTTDFYPTILEMLALPPQTGQTFDGMSVVPALKGSPIHRDGLFTFLPQKGSDKSPPGIAVLSGDWKLYRFFYDGPNGQHRYELYDLSTDIRESKNLASSRADMVTSLDAKIEAFLAGSAPVLPTPNPLYGASL